MRQKLTITFTTLLLMIFTLVQLNGQAWQVYDGSQLPVDAGLQSSDVGGVPIVHSIINDADIPFNRIYEYRLLGPDSKQQWRSPYSTSFDSITIVARLRALSPDISAVQLRIRNGQYRFVIKIEGNRINPDNVKVGFNYDVDAENWHIYRVTVENYSTVKIYLDEAATPVLIDTSSTTTSDTYFRWGDGSDGDPYAGQVDWIVWDTSGAYAPGAGAALPASAAAQVDVPVIYFITDDDRDDPEIEFLKLQGFDVKKFWLPANLGAAGPDTINMLNAADLVIIGRSGPSNKFQQAADKKAWNNLTAPILLNCAWKSRSSRLNWFESTGAYHANTAPKLAYAKVLAPSDPIFDNVTLVGDSLGWNLPPHDFIKVDSVITGDILATYNNTSILIARWDAGDEFYPGALDTANGPRTFMPLGNDDTGFVNYWVGLTKGAKAVMLAEIYRLVGMNIMGPVYPNSDNRIVFITDDDKDDIQINFLRDQGLSVDVFWPPANISTVGSDTVDMLNSYDLVIIGRSGPSSSFQQAADKKIWNALTPPLILNCQWKARINRLNWFESIAAYHLNTSPQLAYGKVLDIYDPVFAGITLDGDSVGWSLPPHDFIRNDSLTNGDILATYDSTSVLMARWDAGEAFYPQAGDTAAGPRTYFGFGNDNTGDNIGNQIVNFFPLTRNARTVYYAEICRILGLTPGNIINNDALLADLAISEGSLNTSFNPFVTSYTVELPKGASEVPAITAITRDINATLEIYDAAELPGASIITIIAENGIDTMQYIIDFIIPLSTDAILSTLTLSNGVLMPEFDSSITNYSVVLPQGTTIVPTIIAVPNNSNATVIITNATELPGTSVITVTAEDGVTAIEYIVNFSVLVSTDATLSSLESSIGSLDPEFDPAVRSYSVILPRGTTDAPVVSAVTNCENASLNILNATGLPGSAIITVTAEDGETILKYYVHYSVELSTDATLDSLYLNTGILNPVFQSNVLNYIVILPAGTIEIPSITAVAKDSNATIEIPEIIELPDTVIIKVIAEDGITEFNYSISISVALSTDASLDSLYLSNGILNPAFQSNILNYIVILPEGTSEIPSITAVPNYSNATIEIPEIIELPDTAIIKVVAEDGITELKYSIRISVAPSTDATLLAITISDGTMSPVFNSEILEYTVELPAGTNEIPTVIPVPVDEKATYIITYPEQLPGKIIIQVIAEDGLTTITYKINIVFSTDIDLNSIGRIKVYPNPANNILYIETADINSLTEINIFNIIGDNLLYKQLAGEKIQLNIEFLERGVYLININNSNDNIFIKLIKE